MTGLNMTPEMLQQAQKKKGKTPGQSDTLSRQQLLDLIQMQQNMPGRFANPPSSFTVGSNG